MKTIVVASNNPVKTQAALNGFRRMFPGEEFSTTAVDVPSGVSNQPFGDAETLQGAKNRTAGARIAIPLADYWVGIEGGVDLHQNELCAFAWVFVQTNFLSGKARTGTFYLPQIVANLVVSGKELGEADDIVFNRNNSKQENGAIGILTSDALDRAQLYEMAVLLALVPFKNQNLYRIS